jgi:hypothetical protein
MMRKIFAPILTAGLIAASLAAVAYAQTAGNSIFFTSKGDIVFPFTPPTRTGTAGTIDNMVVGSGTPRGIAATTLSASGAVTGAGFTALFASPPPLGTVAPTAGVHTTLRTTGLVTVTQGAPAAATVSATLTAANILTGIVTVNQGGAGASAQQLPAGGDLDTALPLAVAGDAFDFSVINISTVAAESASLTTNTGLTLVGDMDVSANSAATTKSAGRFRARKTGTALWTVYRLS